MDQESNRRLGEIIARMQAIQREIAADDQPPSEFQLKALRELGQEYGDLVKTTKDKGAESG